MLNFHKNISGVYLFPNLLIFWGLLALNSMKELCYSEIPVVKSGDMPSRMVLKCKEKTRQVLNYQTLQTEYLFDLIWK